MSPNPSPIKPSANSNGSLPNLDPVRTEAVRAKQFMEKITAILNGEVTDPKDLFCPLSERPDTGEEIGVIQSQKSVGFFSLMRFLEGELKRLPTPHTAEEKDAQESERNELRIEIETTHHLFWRAVYEEFPRVEIPEHSSVHKGWVLVAPETGFSSMMMSSLDDLPKALRDAVEKVAAGRKK